MIIYADKDKWGNCQLGNEQSNHPPLNLLLVSIIFYITQWNKLYKTSSLKLSFENANNAYTKQNVTNSLGGMGV